MFWEMLLRVEQLINNQLTFGLQALYVSCMQCPLSLGDTQPTDLTLPDTTIRGEYQRTRQKPREKSPHSVLGLRLKSCQLSTIPQCRANNLANWPSHTRQTLPCVWEGRAPR